MKKVELIYFEGCPNADKARQNLKMAFKAAGMPPEWTEWEQNDPAMPEYARKYGSPTILIDGKDITGESNDGHAPRSCRLYEGAVPSIALIKARLSKARKP